MISMPPKNRHKSLAKILLSNWTYFLIVPLAVWVVANFYLQQFTPLYLDAWHDGYMLANAYAIRDGFIPYRDTFQIYGMTTSWVHGLVQPSGGHTVLSLRNLSTSLSSLTAALICLTPLIGFKKWVATSAAVMWILVADYSWSDDTWWVLPWSTVTATLLVTVLFILIGTTINLYSQSPAFHTTDRIKNLVTYFLAFVSGILVVALFLTRIAPGALAVPAVLILLFMLLPQSARLAHVTTYVLGLVFAVLVVGSYLGHYGAIAAFLEQTFKFPYQEFLPLLTLFFKPSAFIVTVFAVSIAILILLVLVLAQSSRNRPRNPLKLLSSPLPQRAALIMALFGAASLLSVGFLYAFFRTGSLSTPAAISGVVRFLFWSAFLLIFIIVCGCFTNLIIMLLRKTENREKSQINLLAAVFASVAFSSIVPSISPRYVWWAMPIGVLLLINVASFYLASLERRVALTVSSATFLIGIVLILGANQVRNSFTDSAVSGSGILEGMLISEEHSRIIEYRSIFVNSQIMTGERFHNWCSDAMATFASGRFASKSRFLSNDNAGMEKAPWRSSLLREVLSDEAPILVCNADIEGNFVRAVRENSSTFDEVGSSNGELLWIRRNYGSSY